MTQATMGSRGPAKARANIYTVLVIVAFVALVFAIVTVLIRSNALFGTSNPFQVAPATAGWLTPSP